MQERGRGTDDRIEGIDDSISVLPRLAPQCDSITRVLNNRFTQTIEELDETVAHRMYPVMRSEVEGRDEEGVGTEEGTVGEVEVAEVEGLVVVGG